MLSHYRCLFSTAMAARIALNDSIVLLRVMRNNSRVLAANAS
ncbi:MAG: hypothetical protein AB7I42_00020 [Bradyrhizobium sp.]